MWILLACLWLGNTRFCRIVPQAVCVRQHYGRDCPSRGFRSSARYSGLSTQWALVVIGLVLIAMFGGVIWMVGAQLQSQFSTPAALLLFSVVAFVLVKEFYIRSLLDETPSDDG